MARKSKQAEDPWSGFVDVLSNVVMVVTFLVIILGISMFALSQQVAETMAAEMLKSEESRLEIQNEVNRQAVEQAERDASEATASGTAALEALRERMQGRVVAAEAARKQAEARAHSMRAELVALRSGASSEGSKGRNRVMIDRPLLQVDEIVGESNLTVRSRRVEEDFETIVASSEEAADDTGTTRVEASNAMIKVAYETSLYKIDEETTAEIRTFLDQKSDARTGTIELRTFASSTIGSVSEARRVAYYRAMTVRSVAVAAGYDPSRIKVVLRESEQEENADSVWIFAKPQ